MRDCCLLSDLDDYPYRAIAYRDRITNADREGFNNKIDAIKRSYGFKDL